MFSNLTKMVSECPNHIGNVHSTSLFLRFPVFQCGLLNYGLLKNRLSFPNYLLLAVNSQFCRFCLLLGVMISMASTALFQFIFIHHPVPIHVLSSSSPNSCSFIVLSQFMFLHHPVPIRVLSSSCPNSCLFSAGGIMVVIGFFFLLFLKKKLRWKTRSGSFHIIPSCPYCPLSPAHMLYSI